MNEYHLDLTAKNLSGPSQEQIAVNNQWAAIGLDRYHSNSTTTLEVWIDGAQKKVKLVWNSNFPKSAMKEDKDIANHGGVALAWFIMSVLLDYKSVEQTEIGDGVDYRFMKEAPDEDDLNFLGEEHYVEISGILEESKTNTLKIRLKNKHKQIKKGRKKDDSSSVIVTVFRHPITVKEKHK